MNSINWMQIPKRPKNNLLRTPNFLLCIWPTDDCNLKACKYCFYADSEIFGTPDKFTPTYMDERTANAVINFINNGHVSGITTFGAEPLLNWPILKKIYARSCAQVYCRSAGARENYHNITTNGTLLTEEIMEYLKLHGLHINLSFDGLPEQQNTWRGNSYDIIVSKLDYLLDYPSLQILKTMATPDTMHADVEHIKELGFKSMFINILDPFGPFTYEKYSPDQFRRDYIKLIRELHEPGVFTINDYTSWKSLIEPGSERKIGCGFVNRGLAVGPDGSFYPCHQGPSLNNKEKFTLGNIFDGIDLEKHKRLREVAHDPLCGKCTFKFHKCYVSCWNKHGKFGVPAPKWHQDFERAKIMAIYEINGWTMPKTPCSVTLKTIKSDSVNRPNELLLATLMGSEKKYLLKPFLQSIVNLHLPTVTDYVIVVDSTDERLYLLLQRWINGGAYKLPDPRKKFRNIKILKVPVVPGERFIYRIARGRNMVLGIAKKNPSYMAYTFIDSDLLAPEDTLTKLLSVNDGIVGALVKCRRQHEEGWYNNYIRKPGGGIKTVNKFVPDSILYVDATGSDCVLVRREVFEEQIYEYKPDIPEAEDMGFCFKARDRGFNVRIHTGIKTHHIGIGDVEVKTIE